MGKVIPISIRGHHLESAKQVTNISKNVHARLLMIGEYIKHSKDPFVDVAYTQLKELFSNPKNLLKILAGEKDFICDSCPIDGKVSSCIGAKIEIPQYFWDPEHTHRSYGEKTDQEILEKYNLKANEIYSVRDVRKIMKF